RYTRQGRHSPAPAAEPQSRLPIIQHAAALIDSNETQLFAGGGISDAPSEIEQCDQSVMGAVGAHLSPATGRSKRAQPLMPGSKPAWESLSSPVSVIDWLTGSTLAPIPVTLALSSCPVSSIDTMKS